MAVEYNIQDLIALASQLRYYPQVGEAVNRALNANSPVEYNAALEEATSLAYAQEQFSRGNKSSEFGLPLYMPFEFDPVENNSEGLLLESAVTSLSRAKNIVITELQGRESSVKEFISGGDYEISVSGIICTRGFGYPLLQVKELNDYFDLNQPLRIVHEMLNELGIYDLVIVSYDFPKTPYSNCQLYNFTAISDQPIELTINE